MTGVAEQLLVVLLFQEVHLLAVGLGPLKVVQHWDVQHLTGKFVAVVVVLQMLIAVLF